MSVLADLVSANVTSTGTGTLLLGSAIAGYRPFSVLPDGSVVTYGLANGNQFEVGIGVIGSGGTTLTRSLRSSSTGSLLNLTSGATVSIVPASFDIPPQSNMTATAAPTASNDNTQGYAVGSQWFWPARGFSWTCVDASTGAAVWLINSNAYPTNLFAPREQSWFFDRNLNLAHGNGSGPWGGRWFINTNATLSAVAISGGNGRVALRRGTTTTSFGSINSQSGQQSINPIDGGATWRWKSRINLRPGTQAAPTTAEDYRYIGGFSQDLASLTAGNFAIFQYYQSGGTVLFEARSRRNGGTVQVTSLTLPNADQWLTLEIILMPSQILFLIDGTVVATHTTIPTGLVFDGDDWRGVAGTSSRIFDLSFLATAVNWGTDS